MGADEPPNGGVRITNREIYDLVLEVKAQMAEMKDLPRRVRALELKTYTLLAGGLTGIIAAAAYLFRAG